MTDFEDELESLEDQPDDDHDDLTPAGLQSDDDLESDQWSSQFGESYVEDPFDADQVDDDELDRLENEFFEGKSGPRSRYGRLDEIDDD